MVPLIQEHVVWDFCKDEESLPQGICESCRLKLSDNGKLECSIDYKGLRKRGVFKCYLGKENWCECYICTAGRATKFTGKATPSKATPLKASTVQGTPVKATPVKATPVKATPVKLSTCATCFARLAPGHPHDCRIGARVDNVLKWLPSDLAEQVSSRVITEEAGDGPTATLKRPKGPRMTVTVGLTPEKPSPLTHEDMLNFKVKYNMSDRETLMFANDYRKKHGRGSVQSFLGEHLVDITDVEASFLTLTTIVIRTPEGEDIEKTCVIVKDLQEVIDHIKKERNIRTVPLVKLLGDTGKRLLI